VDEVMLVFQGYSRRAQARTLELIAAHYGMAAGIGRPEARLALNRGQ